MTEITTESTAIVVDTKLADKNRLNDLRGRIESGESLSSQELVFYKIGDSKLTDAVIKTLMAGGSSDQLMELGLKKNQALEVMSIYNVKTDTLKYESEVAINTIDANHALVSSFMTYLAANKIELDLQPLFNSIRANADAFKALRDWHKK